MHPSGQNEFHLMATKVNKLMIIFYLNIIFQYYSITLFSSKNNFVTNNSKKITSMYTLYQKKNQI
jgi:hypothetical protein